ncbi:MAG: cytidine deaminase [Mycoplasmataceae bacterium]|jgi:cytidine deaminase|nr:cytidine deaminase [Mycoplasmataceae bacterium]
MKDTMYIKLKTLLKHSYAPYSRFHTACIVSTDKGEFVGVNVENAAFSPTVCAERNAIFNAIAHGAKKFKALYLINGSKKIVTPCGSCRQVMIEFFNEATKIHCYDINGKHITYTLKQLLPYAFTKVHLKKA